MYFIFLLIPLLLHAGGVFREKIVDLSIPGQARGGAETVDIDKDGLPDYLLIGTDGGWLCSYKIERKEKKIEISLEFMKQVKGFFAQSSPKVADIDADGKLEIVCGLRNGYLGVFDFKGNLRWEKNLIPWLGRGTHYVAYGNPAIADLDKDGKKEILMATYYGLKVVNCEGKLLWDTGGRFGINNPPQVADLNGDGRPEICFMGPFYIGHHPAFAPYRLICLDAKGNLLWSQNVPIGRYGHPKDKPPCTIFDVDGDGRLDVLAATQGRLIAVNAEGRLVVEHVYNRRPCPEFWDDSWGPVVADVDGDGKGEILWTIVAMQLYGLNPRDGKYLPGLPLRPPYPHRGSMGGQPFATKGLMIIVSGAQGGGNCFAVLFDKKKGKWLLSTHYNQNDYLGGPGHNWGYSGPVVLDIDGDGYLELIWCIGWKLQIWRLNYRVGVKPSFRAIRMLTTGVFHSID